MKKGMIALQTKITPAPDKATVQSDRLFSTPSVTREDVLLRAVHHRIRNNLQLISSLLSLEAQHNEKDSILIIANSQERIQTMALLHRILGETLENDRTDISYFLNELVIHLGNERKNPVEGNFEQYALPVDTLIPLGFLISEIIRHVENLSAENLLHFVLKGHITNRIYLLEIGFFEMNPLNEISNINQLPQKLIKGLSRQIGAGISYLEKEKRIELKIPLL